jgi:serine/threonine protein phosphatase PrpC
MSSGSTGVIVLYVKGFLYCGSVGDSRAVVGTAKRPDDLPTPAVVLNEEERAAL